MTTNLGLIRRIKVRVASLSIFARIAIGNSLIIMVGAIGGTLITRIFTEKGAEWVSILLFALAGLALSILINLWIVHTALQPLLELRHFVDGIESGEVNSGEPVLHNPDPDTHLLASSLGSLIGQLEASNRQLRAISRRAIHAQEEERKRIAHGLHDETGQALLTLMLSLERLENQLTCEETETKSRISAARQLAADTLAGLRKIISGLRPAILDDLGLGPAIRWYARENLERAGILVKIQISEDPSDLPPELKTTLFRIAQEAINNISRHSQASGASITLDRRNGEICLDIGDDGQGFNVAENTSEAIKLQHWGLVGIQERAELVGGACNLISEPGKGTLLQVSIPLPLRKEIST